MKWLRYILLAVSTLSGIEMCIGQQTVIDSLIVRLEEALHDTDRVNTLNDLAWELMYDNLDTSISISSEALSIASTGEWAQGIVTSNSQLGTFNKLKGDFPKALEYFFMALKMDKKLAAKNGIATDLGNIGIVYRNQGDYPKALEYFFRALKLFEELEGKTGIAIITGNIGGVYYNQADYPKALEYFFNTLEMYEELGNKNYMAANLSNIGNVYYYQGNYPMAMEYYSNALKMNEQLSRKTGIAANLGNIGNVYDNQGETTKALKYYIEALKMNEQLGNKNGIAINLGNIGALYTETGEFKKAEKTLEEALSLSEDIGAKEIIKVQYEYLSNLYDTTGRPALAFEAYKLYIIYRDSIDNEENTRAQTRTEMKYEYEKAALVAEQEENEKQRIANEKLKRRDNLQYSIILLGLLVLGSLVLGLGRLSVSTRVAEGLIFFSFLILFEFILVLADPYIDVWSGGAPGIKLLFNAGIAACIFPLHAFFEDKLKYRMLKS